MGFTSRRGFTMIELLLIVFLLAVGMTSLILAMNYGMGFVQKTRQKIVAVNLARE
jgi:Tfp pilus assembly protein PilV